MLAKVSVYEQVLEVAADYLGPAADRFIDRQISNHIHKKPSDMEPEDIPLFINWAKIALALLTDDQKIIDEFTERINQIKA